MITVINTCLTLIFTEQQIKLNKELHYFHFITLAYNSSYNDKSGN
jgi:hypothetical protein